MASAPVAYSSRFARAAAAERERLGARLEKAKARTRKCKGELAAVEAEVSDLEARRATLTSLLGDAHGDPVGPPGSLRGHAIREAAVKVLVHLGLVGAPIHYRRWLAFARRRWSLGCRAETGRRLSQPGCSPPACALDNTLRFL